MNNYQLTTTQRNFSLPFGKYIRGGLSKCQEVIFSDRAYISLMTEVSTHNQNETGGILLGTIKDNTWYVIEHLDPGPNSVHQTAYFEYNKDYVNHLANKVNLIYEHPLMLLGLWHRHPGSFDSFSTTDDETNHTFANLNPEYGTISGLVNIDPNFRLTMYHVNLPLNYTKVSVKVGDYLIPDELFKLKNMEDLTFSSNQNYQELEEESEDLVTHEYQPLLANVEPNSNQIEENDEVINRLQNILEPQWNFLSSLENYNLFLKFNQFEEELILLFKTKPHLNLNLKYTVILFFNEQYLPMVKINQKIFPYQENFFQKYIVMLNKRVDYIKNNNFFLTTFLLNLINFISGASHND